MSFASVAKELGVSAPKVLPHQQSFALCFVINKKFLTPFKVLAYSMVATGTFTNFPIILISDDAEVFEDEFVKRVADVQRLVTADDKGKFQKIMAEKVKDVYRLEWIAKYTFLKWLMYDRFDFRTLVYIDSDMVFVSKGTGLLEKQAKADLICCPMFPLQDTLDREMSDTRLNDVAVPYPLEPSGRYRFLYSFLNRKQSLKTARVNSGIQVINERLLQPSFRDALLDIAAAKPHPNEQSVITTFFKKNPDYTLEFASPAYNFKTQFIDRMPLVQGLDMMKHVVNLHYIGGRKPWMKEPTLQSGLTQTIWWKYASEVSKKRSLFALNRGDLEVAAGESEPADDKDD